MKIYVIAYDVHKPGQDYATLVEAIKQLYPKCWHPLESMWIVGTRKSAKEIRDSLVPYIDDFFVAGLTAEAACYGFSEESRWIDPTGDVANRKNDMYEHFNENARKIMYFANQEAQRLCHEYISPQHILLAFVKLNGGLAVDAIKRAHGDLGKMKVEVERTFEEGPKMFATGKKVIESALEEARKLEHNYVGTEHEFLGILLCGQRECLDALKCSGLDLNVLVHELISLIETRVDKDLYERQLLERIFEIDVGTE
jgi:hypothetical protein